jgi:hypothetical protein
LETHHVWVKVSDKGITYHSPWRRDRAYSWNEIGEISTFSYMYPFVFRGYDGRKFKVSAAMTSVRQLVTIFRTHLAPRDCMDSVRDWITRPVTGNVAKEVARCCCRLVDMNINRLLATIAVVLLAQRLA